MQYYQEADRRGEPSAKAAIAHMYQDGLGVKQDGAMAIRLLEQGAANNSLDALEMLAQTYEYGKGTLTDINKARDYYTRAAALGSEVAADWLENHPALPTTPQPAGPLGQPPPAGGPARSGRGARGGAGGPNPAQPNARPPGR
jgi:TPR repeat protein